jgi:hypothetical protein
MGSWKGLDAGGTEQLWDADLLVDVLRIFHANEPFDRSAENSPIYPELEDQYPDITWRNTDATGFRAIFRKTNPWVKLGLTTDDAHVAYVTTIGTELLTGEKSIRDIYIGATKIHQESDGIYSFAVMCRAALEASDQRFTLEDIEYGISKGYCDGTQSIAECIADVRARGLSFPSGSRRIRTLRAFMNALVDSGALINTTSGWMLHDSSVAAEIAQIQLKVVNKKVITSIPTPLPTTSRAANFNIKPIEAGVRTVQPFSSTTGNYDPAKRALLLEKATSIHELLVEKCASSIRDLGGDPIEDQNSFDVASISMNVIIEVKSVNEINAMSQVRKAIAQLLEYRYRHRKLFVKTPRLILVTNKNLVDLVEEEIINFLQEDQGISLYWLNEDAVTNAKGINLAAFLSHH